MTHWFWLWDTPLPWLLPACTSKKVNRRFGFLGLMTWELLKSFGDEVKCCLKKGLFAERYTLQCRKLSSKFNFSVKNEKWQLFVCHSNCEYIDCPSASVPVSRADRRSSCAHTGSLWWNSGGRRRRTDCPSSLNISSSTQSSSLQHCLVLCHSSLKQSRFVCLFFNPLGFVISPHLLLHMPQNRWCTQRAICLANFATWMSMWMFGRGNSHCVSLVCMYVRMCLVFEISLHYPLLNSVLYAVVKYLDGGSAL